MLNIIRSRDCFIFNMVIPIPGKDGLYIDTGSWLLQAYICKQNKGIKNNSKTMYNQYDGYTILAKFLKLSSSTLMVSVAFLT